MRTSLLSTDLGLTPTRNKGGGERWPPVASDGTVATLALDFENNRFWWGGASRLFSDLTVVAGAPTLSSGYTPASGDKLALPAAAFADIDLFKGTFEAEWDQVTTATAGQTALSITGSSGGTRSRCELYSDGVGPKLYCQYHNGTSLVVVGDVSPASSYQGSNTRRRRALVRYADGATLKVATGTASNASGTNFGVAPAGSRWSANGLMYRQWDSAQYFVSANLKRLIYWPQSISDAANLKRALKTRKSNIHMLGDSFVNVVSSAPRLLNAIVSNLTTDYRDVRQDGVGGSTISQQATRWASTPQFYDHTLIIMDGSGPDEDMTSVYLPKIAEIVGRLSHQRWLYVQGGINRLWTPTEVNAMLAKHAQVQAAYPENFVATYDYMRANGTGSTTGANGGAVWAADNYGDDLHTSAMGDTNLGACIAAELTSRGW